MTERGERRRAALLDAATELLEAEGFDALSHRAVAARAGLPLAATTYYFASLDELVEHALRRLAEANLDRARALAAALPPGPAEPAAVARTVVAMLTGGGQPAASLLTFYERYLQAGRRPRLQPLVRSWNAELVALLGDVLRRAGHPWRGNRPRLLLAAVDGLLLQLLVEGDPDPTATATRLLTEQLRG
jgi:DNA-binding transcriptional regulator YbjK